MRVRFPSVLPFALALAVVGCDDGSGDGDAGVGDGAVDTTDADMDGIRDVDEGRDTRVDTDGDGTPDYLDTDSDDDGFLDAVEAGDTDVASPPRDSDSDGIPDFQDTDSDENGFPDSVEGGDDFDRDGIPNYADLDDDNDRAPDARELEGILDPPPDSDGDGAPNFRDPDSDDDFILDGDEFGVDTDRDGLRDFEDSDSDDDGIPDREEAGDEDLYSEPVDSDGDMIPDFRDPDSDNDGLSDADERLGGSDPTREDTDGDGVSDLIETAAGTDPTDSTTSPRTRGDFVFVVPYEEEPSPTRDTLEFRTSIQFADVYFLFDISGSMGTEIDELQTAVTTVIDDLTCEDFGTSCRTDSDCTIGQVCSLGGSCIADPSMSSCVASPWTGAAYYEDQYWHTGGSEGPGVRLQSDPTVTASTMAAWGTFGGTEELFQAVWGVADPMAAPNAVGCETPMAGFVGCPAFREEAVKILVTFTDEDSDGTETAMQAADALRAQGITFIGVWSGSEGSANRQDLVDIATMSDSLAGDGTPLVFDGRDTDVVPAVTAAINEIVEGVPLRVTIEATDEPGDAGDALQFIDYLEINTSGGACSAVSPLEDTDDDGRMDAFPSLLPGTPVCWDVVPLRNDTVEPTPSPQVFRARLTVAGDGSPLDARVVYFLVPPEIEPPGGPI